MNGNDNSRHVRVWFAKFFCLGSSVGRAAHFNERVGSSSLSAGVIIAVLLNTGRNSAGVGQPLTPAKEGRRIPGD